MDKSHILWRIMTNSNRKIISSKRNVLSSDLNLFPKKSKKIMRKIKEREGNGLIKYCWKILFFCNCLKNNMFSSDMKNNGIFSDAI